MLRDCRVWTLMTVVYDTRIVAMTVPQRCIICHFERSREISPQTELLSNTEEYETSGVKAEINVVTYALRNDK